MSDREWSRRLGAAWRNSLQLRVGATTVIVTGAVVLIIGIFLVNEISAGVLRTKRSAAEAQVSSADKPPNRSCRQVDSGDVNGISTALSQVSGELTETGTKAGLFSISIGTSSSSADRQRRGGQPARAAAGHPARACSGSSSRATWPSSTPASTVRAAPAPAIR